MLEPEALRARGIRAALFDKDGTLVDSLGPWAAAERSLCEVLVDRRLPARGGAAGPDRLARQDAVDRMLAAIGVAGGYADRGSLLATGPTDAILAALRGALERVLGEPVDGGAFAAEAAAVLGELYPGGGPQTRAMPGADAALDRLRAAGFPLGLATSDDRERSLRELGRLGWKDHFSFYSFGDDRGEPKPHPRPLLGFARSLGLPPAAVAVIGDTEADRLMAERGGAGLFVLAPDGL